MSSPIWNQLRRPSPTLIATFTEKHVQIVHDSTTQLHQSLDSILSTLNRRAMALTNLAIFESALHDAKLMQQLSPSSALGYIREATINSEQGKQLQAIHVCDKGLSMVDTKDPGYSTLQHAKATAEQRDNKCIDFVSQLPADLVMATLVPMLMGYYISSTKPCPYLNVSTIWRNRIIQSSYGLRFTIEDEEEDHRLQVVQFSQHIKRLDIHSYSKGAWLSDLLEDNYFWSLQEIYIREFRTYHLASFVWALSSISSTLTKLALHIYPGYGFSVAAIAYACPNLESLTMRNPQEAGFNLYPMRRYTKMKHLSITKAAQKVSLDQFVTISKVFPSLKQLTLSPCIDLQPALVVSDYFPSMTSLDCFIFDGIEMTFSDDGGYEDQEEEQQQTITSLSLRCVPCPSYNKHDISRILKKYQDTLVELSMAMESDYNKPEDLWGIQYPRLKRLTLHTSGWWIPRNAPLLEELSLSIDNSNPAHKVFETIPPNLKKLEIMLYGLDTEDHPAAVRYFQSLAQQTQLTHLDIFFASRKRNYDSITDAICHLHQLQHLYINFDLDWKPKDQERCFEKIAKRCSNLKYLEIQSCTAPSVNTLHALNQLEHLEQLSFSMTGADKQEGFWRAVELLTRSLWIKLFHKSPVHDLEIKTLTQRRPDMRITVSQY